MWPASFSKSIWAQSCWARTWISSRCFPRFPSISSWFMRRFSTEDSFGFSVFGIAGDQSRVEVVRVFLKGPLSEAFLRLKGLVHPFKEPCWHLQLNWIGNNKTEYVGINRFPDLWTLGTVHPGSRLKIWQVNFLRKKKLELFFVLNNAFQNWVDVELPKSNSFVYRIIEQTTSLFLVLVEGLCVSQIQMLGRLT